LHRENLKVGQARSEINSNWRTTADCACLFPSGEFVEQGMFLMNNSSIFNPLTLVSAPAGYGKSTLASCWVEGFKLFWAWVSLDDSDNDLRMFLAYFLAAIQSIFPHVESETRNYLKATNLPLAALLARTLLNELDQIKENYILVLDNYRLISEK
jgi:LuxR family maltose regulon positive regulatory protein